MFGILYPVLLVFGTNCKFEDPNWNGLDHKVGFYGATEHGRQQNNCTGCLILVARAFFNIRTVLLLKKALVAESQRLIKETTVYRLVLN